MCRPPSQLTLNFYFLLNQTLLLLLLITVSSCLTFTQTSSANFVDFLSRTQPGDFFLSGYYLFWTNSWYLPLFALFLLVITLLYATLNETSLIHIVLLLVSTALVINYNTLLTHSLNELNWSENVNPLLSNSINKYHPLALYITLIGLSVPYFRSLAKKTFRYRLPIKVSYLSTSINAFVLLISTTLFLGSWWAAQEGSWGGWWNWDASEVFGLFIMMSYLALTHKNSSIKNSSNTERLKVLLFATALVVYFFIQLNFDLVSHNFGTRSDQFIDITQLLALSFSTTLVFTSWLKFDETNFISYTQLHNRASSVYDNRRLIYLVLILWVILLHTLSFMVLLNDLLWKLSSVNVFNFVPIHTYYTPVSIVCLLLFNWHLCWFTTVTVGSTFFFASSTLLLFTSMNFSLFSLTHHTILQLLVNMSLESYQYTSLWDLLSFTQTQLTLEAPVDRALSYISLLGSYSESTYLTLSSNLLSDSAWNFSRLAATNEAHTFSHNVLSTCFTQDLSSGNLLFGYNISVIDSYVLNSTALFITLMVLVSIFFKKHFIILT